MFYSASYASPLGPITLVATDEALTGLWIEGQRSSIDLNRDTVMEFPEHPILLQTKDWLDRYFKGERPSLEELALAPMGSPFRQHVWKILCEIPYGKTVTYGDIAKRIAAETDRKIMAAQAVGGAVGHNPISIIIPCHRVIGANGNLTGYGGGLDKKIWLLTHEGITF